MNNSESDFDRPAARRSSRLRNYAVGMVIGAAIAIVGLIVVVVATRGKELPPITTEILDAASNRWGEKGPPDYDMDLELTGVNPGVAHIEVRGGNVRRMLHNDHETRPHTWDDWSVPGLFGVIRRDLEVCMARGDRKADEMAQAEPVVPRGVFDAELGYPRQYHRVTPTGADAKWRITKFTSK